MFRKLVLTFAAVAMLGTASLVSATTEALARGWGHRHHHHGHHGHWRGRGFGLGLGLGLLATAPLAAGYGYSCMDRRLVDTPRGPRVRWVNVC